jgi:hypothetical protein
MILFFYFAVNVIATYLFIKIKKRLHILEIIVYWLLGSYIFQNYSALCYMNFKTLIIPDKLSYELSHFLNRTVLYPILMVTFLHFHLILSTHIKKLLLLIGFILLLTGLEWLADILGVIKHVHWQTWWSFSFWLAALVLLIGNMKLFRKILYKGEIKV